MAQGIGKTFDSPTGSGPQAHPKLKNCQSHPEQTGNTSVEAGEYCKTGNSQK
jgi:hypothetical protein